MNILLLGYGKMGKTIERIAIQRGHNIGLTIDFDQQDRFNEIGKQGIDVAIEFSQPDAAVDNIKHCLTRHIPVLSGTTGWLSRFNEVEEICSVNRGTFFYASNYSLGVNIFFKLNEMLAKIMDGYPEYSLQMEEIHHLEKKDAPSGTAITLAEGIIKNMHQKTKWVNEISNQVENVDIISKRIDKVPGTHTINYVSTVDNIEIKHTAHSRDGFALGAVMVAEWILDKKGVLGMNDFLKF